MAGEARAADGELLRVEDLQISFHSREGILPAVSGVSFALRRGEVLGVAGESGCGKSVTAQSVLQLLPGNGHIVGGRILYDTGQRVVDISGLHPDSQEMRAIRGRDISMVFQEPMTSFSPVHTIGQQIAETMIFHERLDRAAAMERTVAMLARVGLPKPEDVVHSYSFNLSGGMRQRAMIAMALCMRPKLLIADEPTTAVDVTIQAQILELIAEMQRELGMALIIITHDLAVIAELANRVLIMYLGKSVEHCDVERIFDREPGHPYTRGLLRSVPSLGRGLTQRIEPIEGTVPSLYEIPAGCAFHPRCPDYMPGVCDAAVPPAFRAAPGHDVRCYLHDPARVGGASGGQQ